MLGHWALAEDFACEDEFGVDLLGVLFGFFKHEYAAVDAGVEVFSAAESWVSDDS